MANRQKDSIYNSGKIMMIIAWLLGILLAVKFFAAWEGKQINPNQQVESVYGNDYVEVVLKSGVGGHYLADGWIDSTQVTFLLDTGATQVAISEKLANQLQLKKGMEIYLSTANGTSRGWQTTLKSVQLGGIELVNVQAVIASNLDDEALLGMSFLRQLEFSQRNGQLVLRQYKRNER